MRGVKVLLKYILGILLKGREIVNHSTNVLRIYQTFRIFLVSYFFLIFKIFHNFSDFQKLPEFQNDLVF